MRVVCHAADSRRHEGAAGVDERGPGSAHGVSVATASRDRNVFPGVVPCVMTRPWWQWLLGWLGLAGLLAALPFYAASGLLAPGWAVVLLLLVWLALLVLAIRLLYRRQPVWVPVIAVVAWLIWFGALSAGEAWLGWTG